MNSRADIILLAAAVIEYLTFLQIHLELADFLGAPILMAIPIVIFTHHCPQACISLDPGGGRCGAQHRRLKALLLVSSPDLPIADLQSPGL